MNREFDIFIALEISLLLFNPFVEIVIPFPNSQPAPQTSMNTVYSALHYFPKSEPLLHSSSTNDIPFPGAVEEAFERSHFEVAVNNRYVVQCERFVKQLE